MTKSPLQSHSDPQDTRIVVAEEDFDVAAALQFTRERVGGQVGAIASFVGLVRDQFGDQAVDELFLEHYPGMTERSIAAIIKQARARWALLDVYVHHRVGALLPEDQIVYVQVASAHRADAFAACEFLMDYLKTDAVLWKREQQHSDQRWLEASEDDAERRKAWDQGVQSD
ncbi:MAG: molybdenum cofactor biosynthesis protein MoaE [Pseudomonadales bacterium]